MIGRKESLTGARLSHAFEIPLSLLDTGRNWTRLNTSNRENTVANIKYFSDFNGESVSLKAIRDIPNKEFVDKFPGVKGRRSDGFSMWVGFSAETGEMLPVTRTIEYKSNPSKHECNSKCLNGKHNGVCECRCGGKNHGAGMFSRFVEVV